MKSRIFFTSLFLLMCLTTTVAQGNFKRGFIITNEHDTISGWIDFRTDAQNMSFCKFRKSETNEIITYFPSQIFGYRFYEEGKFYVSREIIINNEPRTIFLEFILEGIMNLYYYVETLPRTHKVVEHYFFENEEGRMIPVSKRPDEYVAFSQTREDLRYRGVIRYIFQDQETISRQADNLQFNHQSMINIAREYHNLTCPIGKECIVFETKTDKNFDRLNFSMYGGVLVFADALSPTIGCRLNIYTPRINENFSIQADLGIALINGTNFTSYAFPLQLGIKYAFLEGHKIRPTLGGGTSLYFDITTSQKTYYRFFTAFYVSAGVEFPINNEQAVFIDVEYVRSIFDMILAKNQFPNSMDLNFLQLKLGLRF